MSRRVVLSLTVYHQDGHDRWCLWLSYVGGIGEVIGSGVDREPEDWHWCAEPLGVAA